MLYFKLFMLPPRSIHITWWSLTAKFRWLCSGVFGIAQWRNLAGTHSTTFNSVTHPTKRRQIALMCLHKTWIPRPNAWDVGLHRREHAAVRYDVTRSVEDCNTGYDVIAHHGVFPIVQYFKLFMLPPRSIHITWWSLTAKFRWLCHGIFGDDVARSVEDCNTGYDVIAHLGVFPMAYWV
jgi:hypothetical protein